MSSSLTRALVDHICQIPGCTLPPTWPPNVGQLCIRCRQRVRSKAYFSPVLFWGMLWLLARRRIDQNLAESHKLGRPIDDFASWLTVRQIRDMILDPGMGLNRFLNAMETQHGLRFPMTEFIWLDHFRTKINDKGQRRIISTYLRMVAPSVVNTTGWIRRDVGGRDFRVYSMAGTSACERVVRELAEMPRGRGGRVEQALVLRTSWARLFPPTQQIT